MHGLLHTLQTVGIFLAFLAARFAVLLIVLAALTVVFLAGLAVVRLAERVRRRVLGLVRVDGLMWRPGLYYAPGHAWLQWRGADQLRVGLDDLAQHVLAKVTEVLLPETGRTLRVGEVAAVMRCGKRRAAIPSPVEGRVVSVNRRLHDDPAKVHNGPYTAGWLFAVEPADASYTRLPYGPESRGWFSGEAVKLSQFLEQQLGMAAADGGELVAPGPALLTENQWAEMTARFLQSPK
jgi:glycine cleavage system H lipoate-binding protein